MIILRTSKEFAQLAEYAEVAKKLAEEFKQDFMPFQVAIDEATEAAPAEFWFWDGVHPTAAGHALLLLHGGGRSGLNQNFTKR